MCLGTGMLDLLSSHSSVFVSVFVRPKSAVADRLLAVLRSALNAEACAIQMPLSQAYLPMIPSLVQVLVHSIQSQHWQSLSQTHMTADHSTVWDVHQNLPMGWDKDVRGWN